MSASNFKRALEWVDFGDIELTSDILEENTIEMCRHDKSDYMMRLPETSFKAVHICKKCGEVL